MNLLGIVAVSGKPGLYKVLGQNKAGYLLETLGEEQTKVMVSTHARLAALDETTVYGLVEDILLRDILLEMQSKAEELPIPEIKMDATQLRSFFNSISPNHDPEKVYISDLKKIVSWYRILEKLPIFTEENPNRNEEKEEVKEGEIGNLDQENDHSAPRDPNKENLKSGKKSGSKKGSYMEGKEKEVISNTKAIPKNVKQSVRKVNTGANKKAK